MSYSLFSDRDPGVSDVVWNELQEAKLAEKKEMEKLVALQKEIELAEARERKLKEELVSLCASPNAFQLV